MWFKLLVLIGVVALSGASNGPKRFYNMQLNEDGQLIAPLTDPFDGIDYRLPNDTKPIHYDIWLSTDIHLGEFAFDGRVTILIEALEDTNEITLHYRQITISNVDFMTSTGDLIQSNVPASLVPATEFLVIRPTQSLIASSRYLVQITYSGMLRSDDGGFYRSSYLNTSGQTVWLATTQFESTNARHAFPCYDEPGIRATYTIQIHHDEHYSAISNTPVESITPEVGTDYVVTKFKDVPSVQTYLIAFIVSDFQYIEDLSSSVPHRIYAKPNSIATLEAELALNVSVPLLSGFEEYLGVPYSLEKMDQAALPNFAAGAMENWGLVTYREQYLLFNHGTGRTIDKEYVITTIAHEFAHQWFGNLINPEWWNYIWLNEGFATLYENHLTHLVYPDGRWIDTFLVDTLQWVLETDANPNIRPMSFYVESPSRISGLFDSVAYSKSGSVLKMFQNAFGDATWAKGLQYYLENRSYNYGTPDHLYAGLQASVNQDSTINPPDVATAMKTWETQAGFPVLLVTRTGTTLYVTQNRFLYANRNSTNRWWIPFNYVVASNPDFSSTKPDFWLPDQSAWTFTSSTAPKRFTANDWIIANIQQTGLYRVNYSPTLWSQIIQQLIGPDNAFEKIHVLNRAQLIDDSFNLARADLLIFNYFFEVINYLEYETDYIPWASTVYANQLLNRWITGSSIYPRFQAFMRKNVAALFDKFGTSNSNEDHRVDRYARIIGINIGCQSQLPACLTQATQRLHTVIDTGVAIEPDLVAPIFCNGMRNASASLFASMQGKLLSSTVQADRNAIITGMGCTQDQELFQHFLSFALTDESLTTAERSRIFTSGINTGEASIRTMVEFLRDNHQEISNYGLIATVASNIAGRIPTSELLAEFLSVLNLLQSSGLINQDQVDTYTINAGTILNWQSSYLHQVLGFFEKIDTPITEAPTSPPATTPSVTTVETTSGQSDPPSTQTPSTTEVTIPGTTENESTSAETTSPGTTLTQAQSTSSETTLGLTDSSSILAESTTAGAGNIVLPSAILAFVIASNYMI